MNGCGSVLVTELAKRPAPGSGATKPSVPMRKPVARSSDAALSGDGGNGARHGLQRAGAEQRHQHQVDAVEAAVDAGVTAADDGLVRRR